MSVPASTKKSEVSVNRAIKLARRAAGRLLQGVRSAAGRFTTGSREARRQLQHRRRTGPSRRLYKMHPIILDAAQEHVLDDLHTHGYAMISFQELVGGTGEWQQLAAMADEFRSSDAVREGEVRYRGIYDKFEAWKSKEYLIRQFPERPTLRLDHPLLKLAANPRVLDIVNTYMDLWAKLHYLDSWYTIPIDVGRATIASQNWHRDYEDQKIVKVWLYYTDVDEGTGAMTYIPGSRLSGGPYSHLWVSRDQVYPPANELESKIPSSQWVWCSAPRGTMIFCDTTGFHRGGYATRGPRLFSTWTYLTPASPVATRFSVDHTRGPAPESPAAKYALQP